LRANGNAVMNAILQTSVLIGFEGDDLRQARGQIAGARLNSRAGVGRDIAKYISHRSSNGRRRTAGVGIPLSNDHAVS